MSKYEFRELVSSPLRQSSKKLIESDFDGLCATLAAGLIAGASLVEYAQDKGAIGKLVIGGAALAGTAKAAKTWLDLHDIERVRDLNN